MKQVIIDSEAEVELAESADFYERRVPGLGLRFSQAAKLAVGAIQKAPERHPQQKDGTRRFVMERFPFVIHRLDLPETI